MTQFGEARKIMSDTLAADHELFIRYQANIAEILLDRGGITDYERREDTADRILRLIFDIPANNSLHRTLLVTSGDA